MTPPDVIRAECLRTGIPVPTDEQMQSPDFNWPRYQIEMERLRADQNLSRSHRNYLKSGEINYLPQRAQKKLAQEDSEQKSEFGRVNLTAARV